MSLTYDLSAAKLSQHYVEPLLAGDRIACRQLMDKAIEAGVQPEDLLNQLVWPTMELLQSLYREDRISIATLNMATRLNRSLTDQLCGRLERKASNGKRVLIFCGDDEPEELGGQICAEMFEADGWTVRFAGGGVPHDEVLKLIGDIRPDLLVNFSTLPSGVPGVRKLIDYLRDVNSCPDMQVMCCGGIYKRAEGLSEEIGADLFAPDAASAVTIANDHPTRRATADQQTVGRTRRVRKAAEVRKEESDARMTANVA
ncbi:MAG TPA: B12-binding domain-containing protein [Tepidisphaeraceae bacterium]|jgi:methanogenic corrinoid protein MtbC1|nr:B12-binding domain-containing protein [Tepidisphaeraceae bacterium]